MKRWKIKKKLPLFSLSCDTRERTISLGVIREKPSNKIIMFSDTLIIRRIIKLGKNRIHGSGLTSSGFSTAFPFSSERSIDACMFDCQLSYTWITMSKRNNYDLQIAPLEISSLGKLHSTHFSTIHRKLSKSLSVIWISRLCITIDCTTFNSVQMLSDVSLAC